MAETNGISSAHRAELGSMANDLHRWAALLNGVSEIARTEISCDEQGDMFHVAAYTCDNINADLCRIAERLYAIANEGSEA